jgi:hypothetical protein
MGRRMTNAVLWASVLCILWGVGRFIIDLTAGEPPARRGPEAETLILIGVMSGVIGQVLFRLTVQVEALERRLAERAAGKRTEVPE